MNATAAPVLGFVPANRGFFSAQLAAKMRREAITAMEKLGVRVVVPSESETKVGCVESRAEAELCAELFRKHDVQGIVIGAVNFGDEQAAAWAVKQSRLDVPVMIFGCQEESSLRPGMDRRDAFCGLLSIGEALRQVGVKYSVAPRAIGFPSDKAFAQAIDWFARVCRVVRGVKRARYGQIGARPEAFWTCRFDEKALQRMGATTVVLDLSEVIAGIQKISDTDADVSKTIASVKAYADARDASPEVLTKMAKFELFLKRWGEANAIDAFAIQCWTSIQNNLGICACTTMSRFGDQNIVAACEADILGTLSMHAALLASGTPAALADWNNLHNDDDELVNVWHCGVFPRTFAKSQPKLTVHGVLAQSGATPPEGSFGTVNLVMKESPLTLTRVTQDDGRWKALVAEGNVEDNAAATFGSYGWARVPNLQRLYRDVLLRHFPHHVAITQAHVGDVLWEAFGNYLGFEVYHATQETPGLYTPRLPFGGQSAARRV